MKKIVLIVEDDLKSLKLFRDLLQATGYAILEVTNGKKAVELAREKKPDLILMDIQMPVMDGFKATKILKADTETRNIPIIALTSYAMKKDDEKMREAGCDGYITKPIDTREFLKKVSKFLSKS